jgi:chromosomal replication initiator protein
VPESTEDSTATRIDAARLDAARLDAARLDAGRIDAGASPAEAPSQAQLQSQRQIQRQDLQVDEPALAQNSEAPLPSASFASRLWNQCLVRLKAEVNTHLFSAYVKPLRLAALDIKQREFVVTAPSLFIRNHVEGNFSDILLCVLRQEAQALVSDSLETEAAWLEAQTFGVKFLVDPLLQQNAVRQAPIFVKKNRPSVQASAALHLRGSASTPATSHGSSQQPGHQQTGRVGTQGLGLRGASLDSGHGSTTNGASTMQGRASGASGIASSLSLSNPSSLGATSVHERRIQSGLNPKYTFSNFVVGNNNQFCNAAAQRVAEEPGKSYNPLFIYGGVGLGKTHLMHAIGNSLLDRDPSAHVVYQSSETFTNELIQALRNAKMDEFKRRMRSVDLLLIDDIQFMSGKERTQEEFFHTFNTLYNAKHQIVITSDKVPQDIPGLEERLQTRFAWGLTADLQAPDFETRVAILRRKAAVDGFTLPEDVAQLIAEKIFSNVRELEGALTRVHAITSLQNIPLTLDVANSALRPLLQPKQTIISVDDIKRAVAQHFNLKVSEIISKRRTKNLSFPRHIAMYLCRKHTTCSYPEIGSHFGNRDHSSVIHAAGVVSTKVGNDTSVRELVAEIERRLLSR